MYQNNKNRSDYLVMLLLKTVYTKYLKGIRLINYK